MLNKTQYVLALLLLCPAVAVSEETKLDPVVVESTAIKNVTPATQLKGLQSGNVAAALEDKPGVSFYTGGGIASLPVVRGLNDDRIKISVDGASISSACANHMNPPLSYVDPSMTSKVEVLQSLQSVADFGDAIGNTIVVKSAEPVFALPGESTLTEGQIASAYRSNNDSLTESLVATAATDTVNFTYNGSYNRSNSYLDGHGDKVYSTQYESNNQSLNIAAISDHHLTTLKASLQHVPHEGFVNQYMDLVKNTSTTISLNDAGTYSWGKINSSLFWQNTDHEMGFFSREKEGMMPMNVEGSDFGYSFKSELPIIDAHTLHVGTDFHRFNLDDRWPAVPGSMMMGPQTYVNINDGHKQIFGNYAEWEYKPTSSWTTLVGVRDNIVQMNTGSVQPYSWEDSMGMMKMMDMGGNPDSDAATLFNSIDKYKSDNNIDLTLQSKYQPSKIGSVTFGYTRKVRSPNMYERYAWGRGTMAMAMIGWYGDANGYVGDLDLKPETAHTLSITAALHDETSKIWNIEATPYITYVEDFIDADVIGEFNPHMSMSESRSLLKFANHDARFKGIDVNGDARFFHDTSLGDVSLYSVMGWVRGTQVDTGSSLYHMMPFNTRIGLEHKLQNWQSTIETQLVAQKSDVDSARRELETAGYAIVNLKTSYLMKSARIDLGVTNLFDTYYELPLGGANYATWAADGGMGTIGSVPGPGRSLNAQLTFFF